MNGTKTMVEASQETPRASYDAKDLVRRLQTRFGFGSDRERRAELYKRIALTIVEHGEAAYRVVSGVATDASRARMPDRYFCSAVVRRLSEAGFGASEEL